MVRTRSVVSTISLCTSPGRGGWPALGGGEPLNLTMSPVPSSLLYIAVCSSWQHVWTKTYATKIKLTNSFISRVLWLFSKFKAPLKFQLCIFTLYFVPGREKFISKFCLEKNFWLFMLFWFILTSSRHVSWVPRIPMTFWSSGWRCSLQTSLGA